MAETENSKKTCGKSEKNVHAGHRERMRERLLLNGADSLREHELLEILLFYAIPRRNTNELAHALLEHFGSLDRLLCASVEEISRVPGVGRQAAMLIYLTNELYRRAGQEEKVGMLLDSYAKVVPYLRSLYTGVAKEQTYLLLLDGGNRLIRTILLDTGTAGRTQFRVRDVMREALGLNAASVILSHNHPGGIALPSKEDIDSTMTLYDILNLNGITLIDHIIIGEKTEMPILYHQLGQGGRRLSIPTFYSEKEGR